MVEPPTSIITSKPCGRTPAQHINRAQGILGSILFRRGAACIVYARSNADIVSRSSSRAGNLICLRVVVDGMVSWQAPQNALVKPASTRSTCTCLPALTPPARPHRCSSKEVIGRAAEANSRFDSLIDARSLARAVAFTQHARWVMRKSYGEEEEEEESRGCDSLLRRKHVPRPPILLAGNEDSRWPQIRPSAQ